MIKRPVGNRQDVFFYFAFSSVSSFRIKVMPVSFSIRRLLHKLVRNAYLAFIVLAKDLYEVIRGLRAFSHQNLSGMEGNIFDYIHVDWADFAIKFVMAFALFFLLRAYYNVSDRLTSWVRMVETESFVLKIVLQERAYTVYNDAGGKPVSQEHIEAERQRVKMKLINEYKLDKTPRELDALLDKIYSPNLQLPA